MPAFTLCIVHMFKFLTDLVLYFSFFFLVKGGYFKYYILATLDTDTSTFLPACYCLLSGFGMCVCVTCVDYFSNVYFLHSLWPEASDFVFQRYHLRHMHSQVKMGVSVLLS